MQEIPSDVQIWASPVKLIEFSLHRSLWNATTNQEDRKRNSTLPGK